MVSNDTISFYDDLLVSTKNQLKIYSKKIKINAWLRALSFIGGLVIAFVFFTNLTFFWGILSTVFFFSIFLIFVKFGAKLKQKYFYCTKKQEIIKNEQKALNQDYSAFDKGREFINPKHNFSFDLDIFGDNSVFEMLNRTYTDKGKKFFAEKLSDPFTDKKQIIKIQKAVAELKQDQAKNIEFRTKSAVFKQEKMKKEKFDLSFFKNSENKFNNKLWSFLLVFLPALVLLSLVFILSFDIYFGFWFIFVFPAWAVVFFNLKYINKIHNKTAKLSKILQKYSSLLLFLEENKYNSDYIIELKEKIKLSNKNASYLLKKISKFLNALDNRINVIFAAVADTFVLFDIQIVRRIEVWKEKYSQDIDNWFDAIAQFEFLISLANFSFNNPDYVFAEISDNFVFEAKNLGHPLIEHKKLVKNDFFIDDKTKTFIITGANMAGKSTFLRTIGVSFVLAQIGSVVCSEFLKLKPLKIMTNIRITDSLASDESYFYAELKRLKYIVECAQKNENSLIIIDEMLRGTNSADKHKGSKGILKKLTKYNVVTFLATHDIQLSNLKEYFPNKIGNYCFEAEINNDELFFDYKIRNGVSKNLNASYLMNKTGII